MRAAIYARVSSERQEKEHTIGSQLEALRTYAAKNGMEIVEEFTDEGYSGARLDRPALDRMRDLAERHGFEVLLTYCTDRLARKFVLQALILDELERFSVKTIFLEGGAADDPLSKLMHQITGAVAEFERAKITERYRRGKLYRARCGEIVSPDVPCGYVKIPRRDGVPAHAEIQEAEAVVVRRIFDAYVGRDLTVRQIAKELTLDRTPTSKNRGQWSWSAVDRILREEAYIGTYYYNRKQCVPIDGVYGKKRQRFKCTMRPKEEWIPISVPPIIDLATFHAAAGRARENEAFSPRNLQRGWLLAAQARPLWPMRMQLLGTHEQTSLQWEGSQQPLLWLPAHHQRLSQAGAMLATAYPRRCAGRIGVGRSEHQAAGPDARPGSSPDP